MSRTYHQRARILVVDNSEINREMLNDILGETYEIRLAGSGREALEILEKEHWNLELVLLKLEMPDIDGYELRRTGSLLSADRRFCDRQDHVCGGSDPLDPSEEGIYLPGDLCAEAGGGWFHFQT